MKFLFLTLFFVLTGCISQLFKEPRPSFQKEFNFAAPAKPFIELQSSVYPSWKSQNTSNVISLISDCSENQFSAKSALSILNNSVDKPVITNEKKVHIMDDIQSVFQKLQGEIEQQKIEIQSISFKYKNCFFITSISGLPNKISEDLKIWEDFNKSFKDK